MAKWLKKQVADCVNEILGELENPNSPAYARIFVRMSPDNKQRIYGQAITLPLAGKILEENPNIGFLDFWVEIAPHLYNSVLGQKDDMSGSGYALASRFYNEIVSRLAPDQASVWNRAYKTDLEVEKVEIAKSEKMEKLAKTLGLKG